MALLTMVVPRMLARFRFAFDAQWFNFISTLQHRSTVVRIANRVVGLNPTCSASLKRHRAMQLKQLVAVRKTKRPL